MLSNGKYILKDKTVPKEKLDLVHPVFPKDPVTKDYLENKLSGLIRNISLEDFNNENVSENLVLITNEGFTGIFIKKQDSVLDVDNILVIEDKNNTKWERQFDGTVLAEWFGVVGDGVFDNTQIFQKLFLKYSNYKIKFPKDQIYYISDNTDISVSVDVDFNGSKVIAPKGLFDRVVATQHQAGNYVNVKKGDKTFPHIEGITNDVKEGNIILIRCATAYQTLGNYFHGAVLKVTKVNSDKSFRLSQPIYESFQVDNIQIYKGSDLYVKGLNLDMTTGNSDLNGIRVYGYNYVQIGNSYFNGSDFALGATELVADKIIIRDSETHNFINTQGTSSGGRQGYGFGVTGNYVSLNNTNGSDCKHVICVNYRNITTLAVWINGLKYSNDLTRAGELAQVSGGGPVFQHALDFHGSVKSAFVDNYDFDGCNGVIAIRNGNCKVNNLNIKSRTVSGLFRNDQLISIYERPVENIEITNTTLIIDEKLTGQMREATFMGIQPSVIGNPNGDTIIVDGLYQKGGRLFEWNATIAASTSYNMKNVIFKNIIAEDVVSGISIMGTSSTFKTGTLDNLEFHGDITIAEPQNDDDKAINLSYNSQIKTINFKGSNFYCKNQRHSSAIRIFVGNGLSPEFMDFSDTYLESGASGFSIIGSTGWGTANFRNMILKYNVNAKPELANTSIFGLYTQLLISTDEWNFRGSRFYNKESVATSNSENLRFNSLAKVLLDDVILDTDVFIGDKSYEQTLIDQRRIPYSVVNTKGSVSFAGLKIRDGKLYIPTELTSNQNGIYATPNSSFTKHYEGMELWNEAPTDSIPYKWVRVGGKWFPRWNQALEIVSTVSVIPTKATLNTQYGTQRKFFTVIYSNLTPKIQVTKITDTATGDWLFTELKDIDSTDGNVITAPSTLSELKANTATGFRQVYLTDKNISGNFVLDNFSTITLDDSIAIEDAIGNKWVREVDEYIFPEWFGAKGNGITDDTVSIQKAIDYAGNLVGGGTVYFRSEYKVSTVVVYKELVNLIGKGTIKGFIQVGGTVAKAYESFITGLTFSGADSGVILTNARRVTINHNRFYGCTKGVQSNTESKGFHTNAQIEIIYNKFIGVQYDCYFDRATDANGGEWGTCSDFTFSGNVCADARITHFWAFGLDGLKMVNNVFFFLNSVSGSTKENHLNITANSDFLVISNNNFFECGKESIKLRNSKRLTITGNNFAWSGQRDVADVIHLVGNVAGYIVNISGNMVDRFSGSFLGLEGVNMEGVFNVTGNSIFYADNVPSYSGSTPLSSINHYLVNAPDVAVSSVRCIINTSGNTIPQETSNFFEVKMGATSMFFGNKGADPWFSETSIKSIVNIGADGKAIIAKLVESTPASSELTIQVSNRGATPVQVNTYKLSLNKESGGSNIVKQIYSSRDINSATVAPCFYFTVEAGDVLVANKLFLNEGITDYGTYNFHIKSKGKLIVIKN